MTVINESACLQKLSRLLNRKRLTYPFILAIALWGAWLISIVLGPGLMDLAGHVVGTDYLEFYAAGYTLRLGEAARLYDLEYQSQLQVSLIGPTLRDFYGFITPPFYAWLYMPLAMLPYPISFAFWSLAGLGMLAIALRLVGLSGTRPYLYALTFFPVFASISYGQNSLLSLLLLAAVYRLWRDERPLAAGLALSLITYKPQLALGVLLLWLIEWRREWRALAGFALGAGGLALTSFLTLPEASRAYITFARDVLPGLPGWKSFPLWNLHSVRGFWWLLLPGLRGVADGLYVACVLAGMAAFLSIRRRIRSRPGLLYAAAICLTVWITPHAMIYDWAVLLIPAALFWQEGSGQREHWRAIYAVIWLAALVSGPLTLAQQAILPLAVQASVPALGWALCVTRKELATWQAP